MEGLISRLHVIVVGPGLGREERTQSIGRLALETAKAQEKYVVIDADGLWLIQNEPHLVQGYKRAVLTPNVVEFKRLCDSMVSMFTEACMSGANGRSVSSKFRKTLHPTNWLPCSPKHSEMLRSSKKAHRTSSRTAIAPRSSTSKAA